MQEKFQILIVEDSETDAILLQRALIQATDASVRHVGTAAAAREELGRVKFDVVLTDLSLPDAHHIEAVEKLKSAAAGIPIIVFTSSDGLGVECMQAGAEDYLVKGQFTPERLSTCIRHAIERKRVEIRHAQELARELAEKQQLLDRLHEALEKVRRLGGF
jgi:two-component system cell cycle response regulator